MYRIDEIVNKFLFAGDKFMPEIHLKQRSSPDKSGFTYSACGPFTKKKKIKNSKKQETQTVFTKMNLIKLVFNIIWLMGILKT